MSTSILWFRRDLRLHDNPALNWALAHSDRILAVYIHDQGLGGDWTEGGATRWWLHHSLQRLQRDLRDVGIELQMMMGVTGEKLHSLVEQINADHLVYNRRYEPLQRSLEDDLDDDLSGHFESLNIKAFDSSVLFVPGTVLNKQSLPYRVYTPFMKAVRPLLEPLIDREVTKKPSSRRSLPESLSIPDAVDIDTLSLLDEQCWHDKLNRYWTPGEQQALAYLDRFMDESAGEYADERDLPACDTTSRLSASLHFGEITPRAIVCRALQAKAEQNSEGQAVSVETFIKQIIWREFAHHILYHFPHTSDRSMDEKFPDDFWYHDEDALQAWQRGETGVPLVDAGMKQLWETGWMHNRVRMVVASYLTKNLGVHWRHGARWFWDTLVDADLANNSMGWQWVAGCGVDAAPYFRIFNPLTQAEKFDPQSHYMGRWLEQEESSVGKRLKDKQLQQEVSVSRKAALERYKQRSQAG